MASPPARTTTERAGTSLGTTDEGRELLQARLRLFAKTIFWLFGIALGPTMLLFRFIPGLKPPQADLAALFAFVGLGGLGVAWFLLRRRQHATAHLRALDATIMITSGLMIGGGSAIAGETPSQTIMPFTFGVLLLFGRVFIVPSGTMRTFVLSAACMVPLSVGIVAVAFRSPQELRMPKELYMLGGAVIAGMTVALATIGTNVIYGLRREIREAQRFGQYTLDRKLGEGGMGVVYKARHALLRRPTAIKILPPDKAGALDVARFEREVQLTSELTHPNTISIYDYGRSVDGAFYYVMEYLDGIDLERLVARDGSVPAARVVAILVQICEALDEAHERGIIHRDIKPANVILCRRGQVPDFVKVVDFGLVKELARGEGGNVSAVGTIAGTPAYLAPESLTHPDDIGPAIDLYAVGAIGYFLVTGCQVFEGNTIMEICAHHLHTVPVPPSRRTDAPIALELEQLLLSCLAKSPAGRPASARALSDALSSLEIDGWTKTDALAWWTAFEQEKSEKGEPPGIGGADTIAVLPRGAPIAPP